MSDMRDGSGSGSGSSDLRGYISAIRKSGRLRTVSRRVSPRYEVAAVTARVDGGDAVLFEDVGGSGFRMVANLVGTRERFARAVGIATATAATAAATKAAPGGGNTNVLIHRRMARAIRGAKRPRVAATAAFMQNRSRSAGGLPVVTHFGKESGPFITSSIVYAKNPDTGRQNSSFHRLMPVDGTHFTIRMVEGRHLHRCFVDAGDHGEDLRVAVTVGVHPAVSIAGAYQHEWGSDEMDIANSLLGGRLTVTHVPYSGMAVPSGAEIVMEGRILQDRTHPEWMVEMLRTYDQPRRQPVFELEGMYYRNNPVFHDILSGYAEHRLLMGMPVESKLYGELRRAYPNTRAVSMTGGGSNWLHAVVQIGGKKKGSGDGKRVIKKAFAVHRSLKQVTVVDDDIDPDDAAAVEYAMATRFQADRDLVVIKDVRGSSLDPSSDQKRLRTAKMGIDATRPLGKRPEGFEMARIPGQARYDSVDYFK